MADSEGTYKRREIDSFHDHLDKKLDWLVDDAKEKNERLKKLEMWRSFAMGGLSIVSLILVPILIYIINQGL